MRNFICPPIRGSAPSDGDGGFRGELSRIMLVIKTVVADKEDTPTLIFDEIDTGISGITAGKVAEKMHLIGESRQGTLYYAFLPRSRRWRTRIMRLKSGECIVYPHADPYFGRRRVCTGAGKGYWRRKITKIYWKAREMKELAKREI